MSWTQAEDDDEDDDEVEEEEAPAPVYELEEELRLPTPRKVSRRVGTNSAPGCVFLFITPHTLIGFFLLYQFLRTLLIACLMASDSTTLPAVVRQHNVNRNKNGINYSVNVAYSAQGKDFSATYTVDQAHYAELVPGHAVQLRINPHFPDTAFPVAFSSKTPFGESASLGAFALFWCGVLSIFWYVLLFKPLADKKLVSIGLPATAIILDKRVVLGKSTSYALDYSYQAPDPNTPRPTPVERKGSQTVPEALYNVTEVGDLATVLYHPARPNRSVLYKYGDYQVD